MPQSAVVTLRYWICASRSHVTPVAQVADAVETFESSAHRFCHLRSMASTNTRHFYSSPSPRILQLARPRESKTVWLTTPVKKPVQAEEAVLRGTCPSSFNTQYELVSRLSTPNLRHRRQAVSPPHTHGCEHSCPVWHISSAVRNAVASPRILQLSQPRRTHPEYKSNRQTVETGISFAAKSSQVSQRLEQLCVPRLRESKLFYQHGRPESPIRCLKRQEKPQPALV